MTYSTLLVALLILLVLGVVWMFATAGEKKIFTGKLVGLATKFVGFSALFGVLVLLYRDPLHWVDATGLFLLMAVAFGLLSWWYWHKQRLLELDETALLRWEFPQAFSLWALAALVVVSVLWAKGFQFRGADPEVVAVVAAASLVFLLPVVVLYAFHRWNLIPVVREFREAWRLPLQEDAPLIEPSAEAIRLFFEIPVRENAEEMVHFDVRVPHSVSLGRVLHHLLYQNNIRERSRHRITIALEKKADYLYGWLLYRNRKTWRGMRRAYLDMDSPVRQVGLINGEKIYAERVRVWENQTATS